MFIWVFGYHFGLYFVRIRCTNGETRLLFDGRARRRGRLVIVLSLDACSSQADFINAIYSDSRWELYTLGRQGDRPLINYILYSLSKISLKSLNEVY